MITVFATSLTVSQVTYADPVLHTADYPVITAVQTASNMNASEEFIELYNGSGQTIDLSGWQVEYRSASGTAWINKCTLSGLWAAHDFYLLASTDYVSANASPVDGHFAPGLAKTGGALRITKPELTGGSRVVVDVVVWGSAPAEGSDSPAPAPNEGQSLVRAGSVDQGFIDSGNSTSDWLVANSPVPRSRAVTVPIEVPGSTPTPIATGTSNGLPSSYEGLQLNELLPDPAAPATDEADEFVEIINQSSNDILLDGLALQAGSSTARTYNLHGSLAAGSVVAFYARDTKLTLANGGSSVRLMDVAHSKVLSEVVYSAAQSGKGWGLFGGQWQWSAPSPDAANTAASPAVSSKTAASPTAKASSKPTATPKPSATTKAKTDTKSSSSDGTVEKNTATTPEAKPGMPIHPWVLAIVGVIALGYCLYEYRADIANRIWQFRHNRSLRRTARQEPKGG